MAHEPYPTSESNFVRPPMGEQVDYGRSLAIAAALQAEKIDFSFIPLAEGGYEGVYVVDPLNI